MNVPHVYVHTVFMQNVQSTAMEISTMCFWTADKVERGIATDSPGKRWQFYQAVIDNVAKRLPDRDLMALL